MKKALYFGLDLSTQWQQAERQGKIIHCPIIEIKEKTVDDPSLIKAYTNLNQYTHILLTSKIAAALFFRHLSHFSYSLADLNNKIFIAVGKATAKKLEAQGIKNPMTPQNECSEGIVDLLKTLNLFNAYLFWPCSELSRSIIPNYLNQIDIAHSIIPIYTPLTRNCKHIILESLPLVDELIFTSPSTVDAFLELCGTLPEDKKISSIGPITTNRINEAKTQCKIHTPSLS